MVREGTPVTPDMGQEILKADGFTFTEKPEGFLELSVNDAEGQSAFHPIPSQEHRKDPAMKFQKNNRSSLFLIELIFAYFSFLWGSAVCIQAFAKAHQVCNEASDLSFASAQASALPAVLRYTDGHL